MTKIVNLRNNIFNMMRYDRDEFLYLYNKTIDRLASYSVEEIENMEELDIFKEGIGSTDFKVFNIIKILNFTMKKFNPRFDTHERQIYCDARLRYIENRKKEIQKQLDNMFNLEKIPGQEVEDVVNLKDELLKLTFEEKDNHIHFYETNDETKIDNSEVGENIENVKVVGGYLDAIGTIDTSEEELLNKGDFKEAIKKHAAQSINTNTYPNQAGIQELVDQHKTLEKKYVDIPEILNNSNNEKETLPYHDKIIPTTLELLTIINEPYSDIVLDMVLKDNIKSLSRITGCGLTDPVIDDYIVRYKLVDKLKKELEKKDKTSFANKYPDFNLVDKISKLSIFKGKYDE